MRLCVKVKAGSKQEKVQQVSAQEYQLWVKAPAKEGKANHAVVALLSEHLSIPKSRITILKGHTSARKIVEIIS